jgi:dipeptidyl aminopeptidase/acylaminoacyl peptidase
VAIAAAAYLLGRRGAEKPPVSFQQLTFRRGAISAARFGPDGQTFVYSARWEGAPPRIFTGRAGSVESSPLAMPNAALAGVSSRGELLAKLESFPLRGFTFAGTLASAPLAGGSPRALLENIQWADWAPDGARYALVRDAAGRVQLEFPAGHPLFATAGFITHPRVSPRGDLIAFVEHPAQGDDGGFVSVVDTSGRKRQLSQSFATAWGLAWDPGGSRILFTAAKVGGNRALRAVDLRGREKLLVEVAGALTLHDVGPGGRALVSRDDARVGMLGMATGDSVERDLSWLDWTFLRDISSDGRTILFVETGQGGGAGYSIYVRGIDGSPAIRLGSGSGSSISRDGKWVVSVLPGPSPQQLIALPMGPGEPRRLTQDAIDHHSGAWLPDGRGFVILGNEPGRGNRLWVQEVGGAARPISPEGIEYFFIPVSPDGKWVAGRSHDGQIRLYSTRGAAARPIPGIETDDIPLRFTEDGRELYVLGRQNPAQVFRVNLETGRRDLWKELAPADPAGIDAIFTVLPAADGRGYVYSYARTLSQLYLVEGLK